MFDDLWHLHFGWLFALVVHQDDYLQIFNMSFILHGYCWVWMLGPKPVKHTSLVAVVNPAGRFKSPSAIIV